MSPQTIHSIAKMPFDGHFSFEKNEHAAKDFGNRCHYAPWAVLHPKSVSDISSLIKYIYELGLTSGLTIAARGQGHSLEGQAQAHQGIVISMGSLCGQEMSFHTGKQPYVDVSAGELWINILHESLKRGLAPKSWTDYLHLTVGGTLSNAGISGQAFKHGPQINNVYQLDFLDRVHVSEMKLREKGMWDVPHPWLNLLIPRRNIDEFAQGVFGNIVKDTNDGPVLIYPVNQSRWLPGTSLITPDEDVFYLVGFLYSATTSSTGKDSLEHYLKQNERILSFCRTNNLTTKRYLTRYPTQEEWKAHFGTQWDVFQRRKLAYDPLAILAPGQRIFQREKAFAL